VLKLKACSPLKLHCGLTGKYHAFHYCSYNFPI